MSEEILYKLFGINNDPKLKKLIGELYSDELFCDTCYRPNQNSATLLKYYFTQQLKELNSIVITESERTLKFEYSVEPNCDINTIITYPISKTQTLSLCNYYEIFYCDPGLYCCLDALIIINFTREGKTYRVKGKICQFSIKDNVPSTAIYCINIISCNCFIQELINMSEKKQFDKVTINVYPPNSTDNQDNFISGISYIDRFTC